MAKVAIKSEKLSPFGGIFSIMEQFDSNLSSVIDSTLGMRCRLYGYQYSEIIRSLMSVYFCGGSCIEDVTTHLMYHLSLHPTLRTCSADTILRAIKELTQDNISYTSDTGKTYDFNTLFSLLYHIRRVVADLRSISKCLFLFFLYHTCRLRLSESACSVCFVRRVTCLSYKARSVRASTPTVRCRQER